MRHYYKILKYYPFFECYEARDNSDGTYHNLRIYGVSGGDKLIGQMISCSYLKPLLEEAVDAKIEILDE